MFRIILIRKRNSHKPNIHLPWKTLFSDSVSINNNSVTVEHKLQSYFTLYLQECCERTKMRVCVFILVKGVSYSVDKLTFLDRAFSWEMNTIMSIESEKRMFQCTKIRIYSRLGNIALFLFYEKSAENWWCNDSVRLMSICGKFFQTTI